MTHRYSVRWLSLLLIILAALLTITLAPYGFRPSALLHIDTTIALQHPPPPGTVVLKVPGYDAMGYYQIARTFPAIFLPSQWRNLRMFSPASYAYQRILLPAVAFIFSAGNTSALPSVFLLINILAISVTFLLVQRKFSNPLYAFALALCPAAMVALHFTLAEPLTLLLSTIFLLRMRRSETMESIDVLLLSLLVLSREVNVLFALFTLLYLFLKQKWRSAGLAVIPLIVFGIWHTYMYLIFHSWPFFISTGNRNIPILSIFLILIGKKPYTLLTTTSIALFLGFVLPVLLHTLWQIAYKRDRSYFPVMLLLFLGIMITMSDNIWGSITSIGRVITPVYPLAILYSAQRNNIYDRLLCQTLIIIGLVTAVGLGLIVHPFFIT